MKCFVFHVSPPSRPGYTTYLGSETRQAAEEYVKSDASPGSEIEFLHTLTMDELNSMGILNYEGEC
jgi:hypothetical protein